MGDRPKTLDAAHGRWREILPMLSVSPAALTKKNHPCPACGGTDRFSFHDRHGDGDYFCRQCGAGKGISLVAKVNGWNYAEAAKRVDEIIGNLPIKATPYQEPKKIDPRKTLRRLWGSSHPITQGDPAWLYLQSRGITETPYSSELRYVPAMFHTGTKSDHPGMIATVSDADGKAATIHRTYLTSDGRKADVDPCRKMMPGDFPKGGAVRLGEPRELLGVAEGIETALAAAAMWGFPVWATTNELSLQNWEPPAIAKHIFIFGDKDFSFVGQHAAYTLARRLKRDYRDLEINVVLPDVLGEDWNDVLLRRKAEEKSFCESMASLKTVPLAVVY